MPLKDRVIFILIVVAIILFTACAVVACRRRPICDFTPIETEWRCDDDYPSGDRHPS